MTYLRDFFNFFRHSKQGSIALMFAFWIIPAMLFTAVAIEMSKYFYVQTRIAYAVDAAALAAARFDPDEADANAKKIFYANLPGADTGDYFNMGILVPTVVLSNDDTVVTVSVSGNLPTIFNNLTGIGTLPMNLSASVSREILGIEVALVLDMTGSMRGDKIAALRTAATSFVDVIYGPQESIKDVSIAIVPYVMAVNIGNTVKTRNMVNGLTPTVLNPNSPFPANVPWAGCVRVRNINGGGELTDANPTSALGRWPVYRAETTHYIDGNTNAQNADALLYFNASDNPGGAKGIARHSLDSYDNDYRVRKTDQRMLNRGSNTSTTITIPGDVFGPNVTCGVSLLPLTNSKSQLLAKIQTIKSVGEASNTKGIYGGTSSNLGFAWGWRTISPNWTGLWDSTIEPKAYGSANTTKSIVLMTDGVSQWANADASPTYDPTAYNAEARTNRLTGAGITGVTTESQSRTFMNSQLTRLCANAKAQGIEIFTVMFQENDATLTNIYRNCASSRPGTNDHFFVSTSTSDLNDHFKQIAGALKRTRLVK